MKRYRHSIDASIIALRDGTWLETENPHTGKRWAEIACGSPADTELAVEAAQRAVFEGDGANMMPFGGYRGSGTGRENGAEIIKECLQTTSVWVDIGAPKGNPFVK